MGEGRALYNLGNVYHAKGKEPLFNVVPDAVSGSLGEDFIVFIALYFFSPIDISTEVTALFQVLCIWSPDGPDIRPVFSAGYPASIRLSGLPNFKF